MIKVAFQIFCSFTDAWFFPYLKPFAPLPIPNNNYVFVSFCKKKACKRFVLAWERSVCMLVQSTRLSLLSDHGNPSGYDQARSACIQGRSPWLLSEGCASSMRLFAAQAVCAFSLRIENHGFPCLFKKSTKKSKKLFFIKHFIWLILSFTT